MTTSQQQVDYDLHGCVRVRLINPSIDDVNAVTRQLGPIIASKTGEPDIIVRFVDRLHVSSPLRFIGVDEVGFNDEGFLVLQGKNGTKVRAQIPFSQIGKYCEILCESGVQKVPLLIPILNLTALSRGVVPLHAAAFTYRNTGVVITGWAKGGKTETLLGFMAKGANYVGDEWVYLTQDGRTMYGLPEPIRLWTTHLDDLPQYRARIGLGTRTRLRALRLAGALTERIANGRHGGGFIRFSRLLKRQQYVQVSPGQLFGEPARRAMASPDKFFFVVSHDAPEVRIERISPEEIAKRMVFSLQHERMDFMSHYLKFRFAFPSARNSFIEDAEQLQREMLLKALADKPAYVVYHPYPAPIPALFKAINPFVNSLTDVKARFDAAPEPSVAAAFAQR